MSYDFHSLFPTKLAPPVQYSPRILICTNFFGRIFVGFLPYYLQNPTKIPKKSPTILRIRHHEKSYLGDLVVVILCDNIFWLNGSFGYQSIIDHKIQSSTRILNGKSHFIIINLRVHYAFCINHTV